MAKGFFTQGIVILLKQGNDIDQLSNFLSDFNSDFAFKTQVTAPLI